MKAIKSLLLVICFLSAFSVAAYAGQDACSCTAEPLHPNASSGHDLYPMTLGVAYNWVLTVQIAILAPNCSGSATAVIHDLSGGCNSSFSDSESKLGYYNPTPKPGSFVNNYTSNAIYMQTDASFSGSNGGGYAYAQVYVSW